MKSFGQDRLLNKTVFKALSASFLLTATLGSSFSPAITPISKPLNPDLGKSFSRPTCKAADMKNYLCFNPNMKAAVDYQLGATVRKDFDDVVARAQKHLNSLKPSPDKLVIFDLDDTLIDNIPYYAQPEPRDFSAWLKHRPVKYHDSVMKLLKTAKERGFSIAYITGRASDSSVITAEQVADIDWDGAYTRPRGLGLTSQSHKAAARAMLKSLGYTIVLNIGDQETDHDLPIDESKGEFLLPNVMYTVY